MQILYGFFLVNITVIYQMDIAKIRKKLKESKKGKGKKVPSKKDKGEFEGQSDENVQQLVALKEIVDSELAEEAPEEEEIKTVDFLRFSLRKEDYAIRISEIEEILRPQAITSVPGANPFVIGITSFRGKMIPVVDIRKRLLAEPQERDQRKLAKIVILRGPKGAIGIFVETQMEVIIVPEKDIMEPPSHLSEEERKYIEGVSVFDDNFVSVINMDELLDFNINVEA
jgi:chemotaxis signal transduction protein